MVNRVVFSLSIPLYLTWGLHKSLFGKSNPEFYNSRHFGSLLAGIYSNNQQIPAKNITGMTIILKN